VRCVMFPGEGMMRQLTTKTVFARVRGIGERFYHWNINKQKLRQGGVESNSPRHVSARGGFKTWVRGRCAVGAESGGKGVGRIFR